MEENVHQERSSNSKPKLQNQAIQFSIHPYLCATLHVNALKNLLVNIANFRKIPVSQTLVSKVDNAYLLDVLIFLNEMDMKVRQDFNACVPL